MNRIIATLTAVVLLLSVTSARADVITDWNKRNRRLKAANVLGNPWPRAWRWCMSPWPIGLLRPARYKRFAATPPPAPSASAEAAAVAAARQILIQLARTRKSKIDEAYSIP